MTIRKIRRLIITNQRLARDRTHDVRLHSQRLRPLDHSGRSADSRELASYLRLQSYTHESMHAQTKTYKVCKNK